MLQKNFKASYKSPATWESYFHCYYKPSLFLLRPDLSSPAKISSIFLCAACTQTEIHSLSQKFSLCPKQNHRRCVSAGRGLGTTAQVIVKTLAKLIPKLSIPVSVWCYNHQHQRYESKVFLTSNQWKNSQDIFDKTRMRSTGWQVKSCLGKLPGATYSSFPCDFICIATPCLATAGHALPWYWEAAAIVWLVSGCFNGESGRYTAGNVWEKRKATYLIDESGKTFCFKKAQNEKIM